MKTAKAVIAKKDFKTMSFVNVFQASTKKGMLAINNITEMFISKIWLNKIAIPVTPPSKKPFGSKKALRPMLAKTIPRHI